MMQTSETLIEKWHREYENDPEYRAEGHSADTIEQVLRKLASLGKNQIWLAEQLGVSKQQVSRMFNAPPNLTLLSIARLEIALGTKARVLFDSEAYYIQPKDALPEYEEYMTDAAFSRLNAADTTGAFVRKGVLVNETA